MTGKDIIKRYNELKSDKNTYEALWQELGEFILPRKSDITMKRSRGSKQTSRLFDSTAIHANALLAASMQGALTSSVSKWFSLKMREAELNKITEVVLWLDECALRMYSALSQSNFASEINEVYLDLGAFGTAALYCEERTVQDNRFNGFRFKALPLSEHMIAENEDGIVDTLIRQFDLAARNAVSKFGAENLSEETREIWEKKPDQLITFIQAVFPNPEGETRKRKDKPFTSYYVELKSGKIVQEGGYYEFPFMVPRWSKTAGETFGRGPGHIALPDIRTLNRAIELSLKSWAKVIDPPVKVLDDGVIGSVRLTPGGQTVVRDMDAVKAFEFDARFDVQRIKEGDLKSSIRQIFFSDQLQLQEGPQMTATEVQVRYELMQRILGPTLGRLDSELLNPLITRMFNVMLRYGELPEPPEILLEGGQVDIEYESPMARAQRASEVLAIEQWLGGIVQVAPVNPEVADVVNWDEVFRYIAKIRGVPPQLVNDQDTVDTVRQQRQQMQMDNTMVDQGEKITKAMGNMAPVMAAMKGEQVNE